jgi:hypothetical protein
METANILIEIHYRRAWDGLPTSSEGILTRATLGGTDGLPVVRLTGRNYRTDDGRLAGEILAPVQCPPLTLRRPLCAAERPLLEEALAQGYHLAQWYDPLPVWPFSDNTNQQ